MENEADILAKRGKTGRVFWTFASGDEAMLKRIYKRMTREEFIEVLDEKGYSYEIEGDKIVVTEGDEVGRVMLRSLKTLPLGVEFKNGGDVDLRSLETIPLGVEFKNGGAVDLRSLETIPPVVEFKNKGPVYLESLVGGRFSDWSGNIEGVDSNRLLNVMISKGLFDR